MLVTTSLILTAAMYLPQGGGDAAAAQTVPHRVNFQGRLADNQGQVLPDGSYNVRFRIYDAESAGTQLWEETRCYSPDGGSTCDGTGTDQRVTVENGTFSVQLGEVNALPDGIFTDHPRYLEVELPTPGTATDAASPDWSEGPFTPRQRLASTPYAFNADEIDGYDSDNIAILDETNTFTGDQNIFQTGTDSTAGFQVQNSAGTAILNADTANQRVGVNTDTPDNALTVSGDADITGSLGIGTTTPAVALDVSGQGAFTGTVSGADATSSGEFVTLGQLNDGSSTNAFVQDGNSFGALATLGTNDTQDLALETDGIERVRLTQNGNLSITDDESSEQHADTSYMLNMNIYGGDADGVRLNPGDSGTGSFVRLASPNFYNALQIGTLGADDILFTTNDSDTRMTIESAGNIGIGTQNPDNLLTVAGNTDITGNLGLGTTTPAEGLTLGSDATHRDLLLSRENTATDTTQYASNDIILQGSVWDETNTQAEDRTITMRTITGSGADGSEPYRLALRNDAGTEFVTFDGLNQRVGVGTSSPTQQLDVSGSVHVSNRIGVNETAPGAAIHLSGGTRSDHIIQQISDDSDTNIHQFQDSGGNTFAQITARNLDGAGSGDLQWRSADNYIFSGGNLGIGTSSPSVALDVSGQGAFTGTVSGADATTSGEFATLGQINDGSDTSTNAFVHGGNSFGATAALGTNDTQNLAFQTDGAQQMLLNTKGQLGIATNSPEALLHVAQTDSTADISGSNIVYNVKDETNIDATYEQPFIDHLENAGATVTIVQDGDVAAHDYSTEDLLIIRPDGDDYAEHPEGDELNSLEVPIISMDRYTTRHHLSFNVDNSSLQTDDTFFINDEDHPLATGFSGAVIVYSASEGHQSLWGAQPPIGLDSDNEDAGVDERIAVNGEKRAHWSAHYGDTLTNDGFSLFDNTVEFALTPITPSATFDGSVGVGMISPQAELDVSGSIAADGINIRDYIQFGDDHQTAIGENAGISSASSNTTAIGYSALRDIDSGERNTATGSSALLSNTSGNSNVAYGIVALRDVEDGSYNVAMGDSALSGNVSGNDNVAIGHVALSTTEGNNNIALGALAGNNLDSGSDNILIGHDVQASSGTASNEMNIGDVLYSDLDQGHIGIGIANPSSNLEVVDSGGDVNIKADAANGSNAYLRLTENSTTDYGGMFKYDGSSNVFRIGTIEDDVEVPILSIPRGQQRVGVGTTAPQFDLEVATDNGRPFGLTRYGDHSSPSRVRLLKARGSEDAPADVQSGDVIGSVTANAYRNGAFQGSDSPAATVIRSQVTDTVSGDSVPSSMTFRTTGSGDTSNTERMRITHNGNIGIGTASPSAQLEVAGAANFRYERDGVITSNTTISRSNQLLGVDTSGGAVTITLASSMLDEGGWMTIKDEGGAAGTNGITVETEGTETIDGATSITMSNDNQGISLYTDGSDWFVYSEFSSSGGLVDYAEYFGARDESLKPGEIVVPDASYTPEESGQADNKAFVEKSTISYQKGLMGIVSTDPHEAIGRDLLDEEDNPRPIALSGRVPLRVTDENGSIEVGDYVTSSSKEGVGMKATSAGPVVGRALESHDEKGEGAILVFADNTYYNPAAEAMAQSNDDDAEYLQNGDSAQFADLNVSGETTLDTLTVKNDAKFEGKVTVKKLDIETELTVGGHIISRGDQPDITAGEALMRDTSEYEEVLERGEPEPAEINVEGTETAGTIRINTNDITMDTSEDNEYQLVTIEFGEEYEISPRVVTAAKNADSADVPVYVELTDKGFVLKAVKRLDADTTYEFDYHVISSEVVEGDS